MKVDDIKDVVDREPFRPFTLRLNDGAQYSFKSRRDIGAAKNYNMIFYFADGGGATRIDRESIVEIIGTE